MSKSPTVTYELFITAVLELEKDGQRVSVRAIRDKIGGATSKLVEFLRLWKNEKQLASVTNEDMSDAFRQALLAEFGRIVQKTKATLENQLADEKATTQETLELLAETEKRIASLEETISNLKKMHEVATTTFDKKTAALDARLTDSIAREADLIKKLESTQNKLHQSEIEAAVLESRCEALEKQHSSKDKKV
jgi:chromosome segregation ATPase